MKREYYAKEFFCLSNSCLEFYSGWHSVYYACLILPVLVLLVYTSDTSLSVSLYLLRLSTKPGSVPSILKSHSLTATTQFLASNTVWRFRQGVHLYYQTTMMSSMEDYPVSSVQVWLLSAPLYSLHLDFSAIRYLVHVNYQKWEISQRF